MTPERYQEVDRVFRLALEQPATDRLAFITNACAGDDELRAEVQSLLHFHDKPLVFLDDGPSPLVADLIDSEGESAKVGPPPQRLAAGTAVGRYVVIREVGGGGMGFVYLARDPELNRKVAIKLLRAERSRDQREGRERLLREAQAMAQLSHPNAIAVHDVGTFRDQVFIAMEYVDGSTLAEWLTVKKRRWREIVSIFAQAGRGLAAAHAAGLVHRDFKPDNVLVGNDGRVRVLDFGLARVALAADGSGPEIADDYAGAEKRLSAQAGMLGVAVTKPGKLMGTPAYMAPEQLMGQLGDARTDQFSFCVALYQGLYGALPFSGETVTALLDQMEQKKVKPSPQSVRVPARLRKVLLRGLSPAREDRYASMDLLLHELTRRLQLQDWRLIVFALAACLAIVVTLNPGGLRQRVLGKTQARPAKTRPVNPEAYEAYLQGRFHLNRRSAEEATKALQYFQQAVAIDPNYAAAYSGVSDSYQTLALYSGPKPETWQKAKAAASRALELDDTLAEAHRSLAKVQLWYDWDVAASERENQRAVELNPGDAESYQVYGGFLYTTGRSDEAIAMNKRAQELDPLSPVIAVNLAMSYYSARQYDQAIKACQKALELDPAFIQAHRWLGLAYEGQGKFPETIAEFKLTVELSPENQGYLGNLARVYAVAGMTAEARQILAQLKEQSKTRYVAPLQFGLIHAALGERDEAFAWLEKAFEERNASLLTLSKPWFDPLRSDPRFADLVRRVGLATNHAENPANKVSK